MLQFVVRKGLKKLEGARIAGVGIKALDESLHHRPQIGRGVHPFVIRLQLKGCAIEVEAAVEIRKALAIVLIPQDCPLAQHVSRI